MTAIIFSMDKRRSQQRLATEARRTHEIGLRIVAARKAVGLDQASLCRFTGFPSSQVSQWETGRHRPSLDAAVQLLPYLDVTLDYLFLGDKRALNWDKATALDNAYEDAIEEAHQRAAAEAERGTKIG
jgi:transcriptional regulator with XRE-family HTH domain